MYQEYMIGNFLSYRNLKDVVSQHLLFVLIINIQYFEAQMLNIATQGRWSSQLIFMGCSSRLLRNLMVVCGTFRSNSTQLVKASCEGSST
jgi:hypothetical protein